MPAFQPGAFQDTAFQTDGRTLSVAVAAAAATTVDALAEDFDLIAAVTASAAGVAASLAQTVDQDLIFVPWWERTPWRRMLSEEDIAIALKAGAAGASAALHTVDIDEEALVLALL